MKRFSKSRWFWLTVIACLIVAPLLRSQITIGGGQITGATMSSGNSVSASQVTGFGTAAYSNSSAFSVTLTNFTAYAAGTVYSLTGTSALLDFGTTDPAITIQNAGTYLISARASLKYNAVTFLATQTVTLKLRRTNNTAADLSNATVTETLRVITTITDGAGNIRLPDVIYTASAGDTIQFWGGLSAVPSAGSVDVASGEIIAIRIY